MILSITDFGSWAEEMAMEMRIVDMVSSASRRFAKCVLLEKNYLTGGFGSVRMGCSYKHSHFVVS